MFAGALRRRSFTALAASLALAVAGCAERTTPISPEDALFGRHGTAPNQPITIAFEKDLNLTETTDVLLVWSGPVWVNGTQGTLVRSVIDLQAPSTRITGRVLHAEIAWEFDVPGIGAFTIITGGIANLNTGMVRSNGQVVTGWLEGAQVHQQGQLSGPDGINHAEGFLRVMPMARRP